MVAAESALALGHVNLSLGRIDQAKVLADSAIKTLATQGKSADLSRFEAEILGLKVRAAKEADAQAEEGARALVQQIRDRLGDESPIYYEASNLLGDILLRQSKFKEAIAQYRQVLDTPPEKLPLDNTARETARGNLPVALRGSGDIAGTIAVLTDFEKELTQRRGAEHPFTLSVVNNLAIALQNNGQRDEALALYDRAYAGRVKVLGSAHPDTLNVLQNRATLLIQTGKPAEAEPVLRDLLVTLRETRQKNHPAVLVAMNSLAYALEDLDRLDDAEQIYRDTLAIQTESQTTYSESFSTRNNLAMLLMRKGDLKGAEKEFVTALDATSQHLGAEHPYVMIFANNYGALLTQLGRHVEAERLLLNTHAQMNKSLGPAHPRVVTARERLAALYDAMKNSERAADWRRTPPVVAPDDSAEQAHKDH